MVQAKLTDWFPWTQGAPRRDLAALKRRVYDDDFAPIVAGLVHKRVAHPDAAHEIANYVNTTVNLGRTVVETVAVGYSKGVRRSLKDASPELARAFAALVIECGYDRWATIIGHMTWWMGPTMVVPTVSPTSHKLRFDLVTPEQAEVTRTGPDELKALVWQRRDDKALIYVDSEEYRYFDARGNELEGVAPVAHQLGQVPAAIFRDGFPGFDWWETKDHWGLYQATLDVAFKCAVMQFRRTMGQKLVVVNGPIDGVPEGQSMATPLVPVHLTNPEPMNKFAVHDLTVPVADYLQELYALIGLAVSRFGIPPSDVSFEQSNGQWGAYSLSVRKEKLGHLRDQQVPHLRAGERDLWPLICDVVRASRVHKYARILPPGDEVREMLTLRFPDYQDTGEALKRNDLMEKRLAHGLEHPRDVLLESQPELGAEEADAIIEENLVALADINDIKATRNSPDPGKGLQSAAQINGAIGGSTRAANASATQDEAE